MGERNRYKYNGNIGGILEDVVWCGMACYAEKRDKNGHLLGFVPNTYL